MFDVYVGGDSRAAATAEFELVVDEAALTQ